MKRGDLVWIWFDTGAGKMGGPVVLYGRVIQAGPKAYRVRWESGLTNRYHRNGQRAEPQRVELNRIADAVEAMARVEAQ